MSRIKPLPADCTKARAKFIIDGKRRQITDAPDALGDQLRVLLGLYKGMRILSIEALA